MKIYATITNSRGKKEGAGDDKWLEIDLSIGNKHIGRIIVDYQGSKDYDVSYEKAGEDSRIIDTTEEVLMCNDCAGMSDEEKSKCPHYGIGEETANRIQNFGEQHPDFHSKAMKEWRKKWNEKAKKQTGELRFCTNCGDESAQTGNICKFCKKELTGIIS